MNLTECPFNIFQTFAFLTSKGLEELIICLWMITVKYSNEEIAKVQTKCLLDIGVYLTCKTSITKVIHNVKFHKKMNRIPNTLYMAWLKNNFSNISFRKFLKRLINIILQTNHRTTITCTALGFSLTSLQERLP